MAKVSKQNNNVTPVVLCLIMTAIGVGIAIWGDSNNDLQRYSFATVISMAAGLGATFIIGKITVGGVFGFLNIKSVTGGFAVWLVTFSTFFYFFYEKEAKKINKYFSLSSLAQMDLKASFIDNEGNSRPIKQSDLYELIDYMGVDNSVFKLKLTLSKNQLENNRAIKLWFSPTFNSKIGRIDTGQRFFIPKVKGWELTPTGDGGYYFTVKPENFKQETEIELPFII